MLWLMSRGTAGLGLVVVALRVARVAGMDLQAGACRWRPHGAGLPIEITVTRQSGLDPCTARPGSQWLPSLTNGAARSEHC